MTRDDVIRMARESAFITGRRDHYDGTGSTPFVNPIGQDCRCELEQFAARVAAVMRERCAKECAGIQLPAHLNEMTRIIYQQALDDCADAILALTDEL